MNDPELTASIAYIGIGSNLGDAVAHVRQAIVALAQWPGTRLVSQSGLYRSAPLDASGDDFINAVVGIRTVFLPKELLSRLLHLESLSGRQRTFRNAPRVLDLDILLYGEKEIKSDVLTIPHPRLTQRAFVLIPLLQIAPDIVIPGKGMAQQYLEATSGQKVVRLEY